MNIPENYYESPKQPLNIFTEYETMELLKLIEDPEIQKLFATYRKKHKYVWTLISNILAEKNINKSEDKCANRFENMKAKFFKIEKRRMQGYNEDSDWPYYDFFVRFMSNNYITNDMQMQQQMPQAMLHQLTPHQSYNIPKVKLEPGGGTMPSIESYTENAEIIRVNNQMQHPYGFNTNGIPDIQTTTQETKTNFIIQEQQNREEPETEQSQHHENRPDESQENSEIAEEEKQQILISPHYVHHVERTDSENHIDNSNESTTNPTPLPSTSIINGNINNNMNKNTNGTYTNQILPQQQLRKNPNRISTNYNSNPNMMPNVMSTNFNAKFARKFKKIKIDEELMAIRKEKYALELEILRFQLENEKKLNEKHSLDLKILEEKLKHEKYQNQILERNIKSNENNMANETM